MYDYPIHLLWKHCEANHDVKKYNLYTLDVSGYALEPNLLECIQSVIEITPRLSHLVWPQRPSSNFLELKGRICQVEDQIIRNLKKIKLFPSDYELGLLSSDIYNNKAVGDAAAVNHASNIPNQWKVIKVWDMSRDTGQYAALYVSHENKLMVLAHRGTYDGKTGLIDLSMVAKLNTNLPEVNTCFSIASDAYQEAVKYGYFLSITGHSLGGFFAELSAYFIHNRIALKEGPYKHLFRTVTFDSPGAQEFIIKHARSSETTYSRLEDKELQGFGVINYCLGINVINTINRSVGITIVGNFTKIIELEEVQKSLQIANKQLKGGGLLEDFLSKVGGYLNASCHLVKGCEVIVNSVYKTLETHKLENILKIFDPSTGAPKEDIVSSVKNWPKLIDEGLRSDTAQAKYAALNTAEFYFKCFNSKAAFDIFKCFVETAFKFVGGIESVRNLKSTMEVSALTEVIEILSRDHFSAYVESQQLPADYKDIFKLLHGSKFELSEYNHHVDKFWPDKLYSRWSVDNIINALLEKYPRDPCIIFDFNILKAQCQSLLLKVSIKKADGIIIKTSDGVTPDDVRSWIELLKIQSINAADKFMMLIENFGVEQLIKQRFTQFTHLQLTNYVNSNGTLENVVNYATRNLDLRDIRQDHFICGQSGYGKTSFLGAIATMINNLDSAPSAFSKWWVGSDDFTKEIELFLQKISISKDLWMSLTLELFKDELINELHTNAAKIGRWIIIIDGLSKEKYEEFFDVFGPFLNNMSNHFIISADDCNLYEQLSSKWPESKRDATFGLIRRKIQKIELVPYGIEELQTMIQMISLESRDFTDEELEKLLELSKGMPDRLAKLLHYLRDQPSLSVSRLIELYGELVDIHPMPDVWLLLDDATKHSAKVYDISKNEGLLDFLRLVLVLYKPDVNENPSEIVFDLKELSKLEIFPEANAAEYAHFLVAKSIAVRIKDSEQFALHKNVVLELQHVLQLKGAEYRHLLEGKIIIALNTLFPKSEYDPDVSAVHSAVKVFLDAFSKFIVFIKKAISNEPLQLVELYIKISDYLQDKSSHLAIGYLEAAERFVDMLSESVVFNIFSRLADLHASQMDFQKAAKYSSLALKNIDLDNFAGMPNNYTRIAIAKFGYDFQNMGYDSDNFFATYLNGINKILQNTNLDQSILLSNEQEVLMQLHYSIIDTYFSQISGGNGLAFIMYQMRTIFEHPLAAPKWNLISMLYSSIHKVAKNLYEVYQAHKEQGIPINSELLMSLVKLSKNSEIRAKFVSENLLEELKDRLLIGTNLERITLAKFVDLIDLSLISVDEIDYDLFLGAPFDKLYSWVNRLKNSPTFESPSVSYFDSMAKKIEKIAYWLFDKMNYEMFHCGLDEASKSKSFNDLIKFANLSSEMIKLSRDIFMKCDIEYNERESLALSMKLWPITYSSMKSSGEMLEMQDINSGLKELGKYYFGKMTANLVKQALKDYLEIFDLKFNDLPNNIEQFISNYNSNAVLTIAYPFEPNTTSYNFAFEEHNSHKLYSTNSAGVDFAGKLINHVNKSLALIEHQGGDLKNEGRLLYFANSLLDKDCDIDLKVSLHIAFAKVNELIAKNSADAGIHYMYAHGNLLEAQRIIEKHGLPRNLDSELLKINILMCAHQQISSFKYLCGSILQEGFVNATHNLAAIAEDVGVDHEFFEIASIGNKLYESVNHHQLVVASWTTYDLMINNPGQYDPHDADMYDNDIYNLATSSSLVKAESGATI